MGEAPSTSIQGALDRMENTPETARAMISPQTQSHLHGFDGNETRSRGTISLLVVWDPYNVITEFYLVDVEFSHNAILRRPWLHMMKVVSSADHQLVQYPTPVGAADIRGDQTTTRTIPAVAQKKSG